MRLMTRRSTWPPSEPRRSQCMLNDMADRYNLSLAALLDLTSFNALRLLQLCCLLCHTWCAQPSCLPRCLHRCPEPSALLFSPLLLCRHGHTAVIESLLQHGAKVGAKNKQVCALSPTASLRAAQLALGSRSSMPTRFTQRAAAWLTCCCVAGADGHGLRPGGGARGGRQAAAGVSLNPLILVASPLVACLQTEVLCDARYGPSVIAFACRSVLATCVALLIQTLPRCWAPAAGAPASLALLIKKRLPPDAAAGAPACRTGHTATACCTWLRGWGRCPPSASCWRAEPMQTVRAECQPCGGFTSCTRSGAWGMLMHVAFRCCGWIMLITCGAVQPGARPCTLGLCARRHWITASPTSSHLCSTCLSLKGQK